MRRFSLLRLCERWLCGACLFLGRAPAHLASRNQPLANNQAARCTTSGRNPARVRGFLAGDGSSCSDGGAQAPSRRQSLRELTLLEMGRDTSKCSLTDDSDLQRPAGYKWTVTAECVRELCRQGHLAGAVEALGVLVQTDCFAPKSLFCTVLKQCLHENDLVLGGRVHALTVRKGWQSDTFLGTLILRIYATHGRLQDAMDVFGVVAEPDAFTWCAIISAHVQHGQDKQAIELYHRMCTSSVKPDGHVFVAALQACARGLDLKTGQQVHADVLASGIEPDVFVSSCLVNMYAKCGSLEDAQRLFDGLDEKDVVTWTALIAGYSQQGMGQEALRLYSAMGDEGVAVPNSITFVCLLQACASVGSLALEKGKQLHSQIRERGHQDDAFLANSLVDMYAKCGSLEDAQAVFDGLGKKNVVTWNAMIAGYSQQGRAQEALHLFQVMQDEGTVLPDSVTFLCLLQACANVGSPALEKGKQLHARIREQGHQDDVSVANGLVNMYAKCGSLEDAQKVFDGLGEKNVVTWNAIIAGYSQQGMGQEALCLYSSMKEEGMAVPDSVTFVCLLQACASLGTPALEKGKQLHAQITDEGHQADVFVANSLVNMYAKCGSLEDARRVFEALDEKDVVTWTALIGGYSQQGMGQEALCLYCAMQEGGVAVPNTVTFVCLLQACASWGMPALDKGKQLHAQIVERGLEVDAFIASSLVNMYAKCGSLEDAQRVFDGLGQKELVTWTALIAGYSQQGMGHEALQLYRVMQAGGLAIPDAVTFLCLLQACASVGIPALATGKELHAQIREQGHHLDMVVASSIVNMYAKCGSLEDALSVFNNTVAMWNATIAGHSQQGMGQDALRLYSATQQEVMVVLNPATFVCLLQACASLGPPALEKGKQLHAQIREQGHQAEVFVASSLVNMYAKCGSLESAQRVFDELGQKDVVTWTALIAGYSQQGMGQEALCHYSAMQEEGISVPDPMTFVCLLQACANVSALHLGRQLHAQIKEQGLQADEFVANSLINMYGKCGCMADAQEVFDALSKRDLVAWNSLIAGYSCQGHSEVVFDLVQKMKGDGIQPVGITFLSVLTVCSHAGLVDKGTECFEVMSKHYGINPTVEHHTCMADMLGRAGRLDEALALVSRMPVQPNAAIWHTLLGACRKWSNVKVGRHAFDQAVKLDKKDAAAYTLMANIYTSAQMWEQALEMQSRRARIRAWKQPGQSWWTDPDGQVHSFLVGDEKYPWSPARVKQTASV